MAVKLNEGQQAAVEAGSGPALVLAGAGSGKTRVIVERICWLIEERGVDPRRILALTFTNRAAGEMRVRVQERLKSDRLDSWLGTFHSFGLYMLRREMERLGRPKVFTIFDDNDQLSLMKRLIKELPEQFVKVSPREAMQWNSRLKQEVEKPDFDVEPEDSEEETHRELWQRYHTVLERVSAVDFDDLLVLPAKLFLEHEEVREKYRGWYPYMLIDEYQDTNRAQYIIARELAGEGGDVFAVGDEDQSIYSWRGADIRNILEFEKDFPDANIFRLEQNYRSTKHILAAANGVVSNNVERLGKTLWTEQDGGDKVKVYIAEDAYDEARYVVDTVMKEGLPLREAAVLYRTNGQARLLEEAFLKKGLHYQVVGALRFYDRKEIKDVLCYLRLLVNPVDDESLRRIINVPARGIGAVTLQKLSDSARARRISLLDALREVEDDTSFGPRVKKAVLALVELVDDLAWEATSKPVAEVLERLLDDTEYRDFVQKSDEKDFRTRLELLDEFISACAEFDKKEGGTLEEFLQQMSLMSDVDSLKPDEPAVALMTCHAAKGLEFDHVFLVGLEEGLLPHSISVDEDEGVEEERRLCYVAMTRARKTLTLTAARSRVIYGDRKDRELSRFLDEVPRDTVQYVNTQETVETVAKPSSHRVDSGGLKMGTRVRHAKFGVGQVMYTSGSGAKLKVRIRFDTGMSRQFVASMAPLEIVKGKTR